MKRLLFCCVLVYAFTLCGAQYLNSFRYLSTGGGLDDDIEYAYDPLDLYYFHGLKLYSALNNFNDDDRLLAGSGSNYLVLGAATDKAWLPKLKAAVLWRCYDDKTPLNFDCYPSPYDYYPTTDQGEAEYEWQSYFDSNENGLYDHHRRLWQKFENYEREKNKEAYLVLAYALSPLAVLGDKIGFSRSWGDDTYAHNSVLDFGWGDPSTQYFESENSLPDMDPGTPFYRHENEGEGDFDSDDLDCFFHNELGYMRTGGKWEYSGRWRINFLREKNSTLDRATETDRDYYEHPVDGQDYYEYKEQESWDYKSLDKGVYNQLSGRLRYFLVPDADLRRAGYWSCGLGLGMRNLTSAYDELYLYDEKDPSIANSNEEGRLNEKGTVLGFDFNGFLKLSYPLNQHTFLGTGMYYSWLNNKTKGDFDYLYTSQTTSFAGGDKEDWVHRHTETSHSAGDTEQQYNCQTFRVPVGLEYWFSASRKWAMRVGSAFTWSASTYNESYTPTLIEPTMVEDVNFDDQENPSVSIEDNTYLVESHNHQGSASSTQFSYGLCYKPSEQLQIEVMHMFSMSDLNLWNTDFFRQLSFAFTVGF